MNKKVMFLTIMYGLISVLSQGLTALQRSIYLFSLGMEADTYGYLLFFAAGVVFLVQLLIGPWTDKGKNRKTLILAIGSILNFLGIFSFAVFESQFLLAIALILAGIGFTTTFNMLRTLTASLSTPETSSTNLARIQLFMGTGFAIASAAYGYIVSIFDFRTLFLVASFITFIAIIIAMMLYFTLKKLNLETLHPEAKKQSFFKAYKFSKHVIIIMLLYLCISTAQSGGFNYTLFYFKDIGGVSDTMAGWILSFAGFMEIPAMFLVGRYCMRHKKELLIIPFLLIGGFRWILLTMVDNPIWFYPVHSLRVLVLSVLYVALTSMIMDHVSVSRAGAALGLLGAVSTIGRALGPAIAGAIIDNTDADAAMITMALIAIIPTIAFAVYLVKVKVKPIRL